MVFSIRTSPETRDKADFAKAIFQYCRRYLSLGVSGFAIGRGRFCQHTRCVRKVAENRRARFDFEILEKIEAGIMLTGQEVKSCRKGNINLAGSYVSFLRGRPFLKNAKISPYVFALPLDDYDPGRDRELLLKSRDIERLMAVTAEKGVTVVPLEVNAGRFIKVLLGIAKGRKKIDKRHRIRERDMGRKLREGREI